MKVFVNWHKRLFEDDVSLDVDEQAGRRRKAVDQVGSEEGIKKDGARCDII